MSTGEICIVEDDDAVRNSLQMLLERQGMRISSYPSAAAFLKQAKLDSCACFLFDNRLPDLSGVELLEVLRARRMDTPAIIMTADADANLMERADRAGASAVLNKPASLGELLAAIGDALASTQKGRASSPHT